METNNTTCLIEQTKRLRVHGVGPNRKQLVPFHKIGQLPQELVNLLNDLPTRYPQNDLGTDTYSISKHCKFEDVFNAHTGYRQILLQKKQTGDSSQVNEFAYNGWDEKAPIALVDFMKTIVNNIYRFRLSVMGPNHELNWHIDTDPSVICRAQICIKHTESVLEFNTKNEIHTLHMQPGEIYFINTGWSHRVVNNSNDERIVAIFGFEFSDLSEEMRNSILK